MNLYVLCLIYSVYLASEYNCTLFSRRKRRMERQMERRMERRMERQMERRMVMSTAWPRV